MKKWIEMLQPWVLGGVRYHVGERVLEDVDVADEIIRLGGARDLPDYVPPAAAPAQGGEVNLNVADVVSRPKA